MTTWKYALVTGASSGIGDSYARALADQGTNLVLVARSTDKLEALATELRDKNGIKVEVLPADLSDDAQLATVEKRVSQSEDRIDLLINNAGFGTAGKFQELEIDRLSQEIDLNIGAVVRLTHAALSQMVPADSGSILNVSSIAGYSPTPFATVYAATKVFVRWFSEGLIEELSGTGVTVSAVYPGATRTKWQEVANYSLDKIPGFAWLEPDKVAKDSLAAIAKGKGKSIPGIQYKAMTIGSDLIPDIVRRKVAKFF